MEEKTIKNIVRAVVAVAILIAFYAISGDGSFTCDYCGKKSSGTHYTITNDSNKDMCSFCYTSYHRRGWVD